MLLNNKVNNMVMRGLMKADGAEEDSAGLRDEEEGPQVPREGRDLWMSFQVTDLV